MYHLIFGGAGFIGTHLKQHLLRNHVPEANIYSYDIRKEVSIGAVLIDVRKPISINLSGLSNSIIYNMAAIHTTPGYKDHEYFEANILGAENICVFARNNNIETIVFTSSIASYGTSESYKTEETLPMPNTPYGISKLNAEYIHRLWQAEKPAIRKLIIIRSGAVFGKLEGGNFTRLYQSLKKGFFFYPGRKDTLKACVYVKDVVRVLTDASEKELPGLIIYNLSFFPAPTIEQICVSMAEVTKIKIPKLLVSGKVLKMIAKSLYFAGRIIGIKINSIHPDRVKKLMVSTNISGEKLSTSPYKLQYTLIEAIKDWFEDCGQTSLF